MLRAFSIVSGIVACGLIGWAGYVAFRTPGASDSIPNDGEIGTAQQDSDSLRVENAKQELGERPVGEHPVVFRITNHSSRQAGVVGLPAACGLRCCWVPKNQERLSIPPGATIEVLGMLDVRPPGPFEFEGALYLNDGGQLRTVRLKLTGVVVQPKGKPNATPP